MNGIKRHIAQKISELLAIEENDIFSFLEYPPDDSMGDLALPCFKLSKTLKKSPETIADQLAAAMAPDEIIERIAGTSGYLNLFVRLDSAAKELFRDAVVNPERLGAADLGKNKTILIEYSSPNIAKPFHIGHLSTTIIGNALNRIFRHLGYKTVSLNYLGDWGTQFGKVITAYRLWGTREEVEKGGVREIMRLYVRFHEEAEKDPSLNDTARSWFNRMECGDDEALAVWQWIRDISLADFNRTYGLLGMTFDSYQGEAFYSGKIDAVVSELREKGLLRESDGAQVVMLDEYNMPPCLILKKDGSTIYASRDIAAAQYRMEIYAFEKCVYVVGVTQSLHFAQFFKVLKLMGYDWADRCVHVPFGTISLEGKRLASRTGNVVLLDDIFKAAIENALDVISVKNPEMQDKETLARQMGVGAVLFAQMFSSRIKDVSFSMSEVLNSDGETGPYVQYTHARICSVLSKCGCDAAALANADCAPLSSPEERRLIKTLTLFPDRLLAAAREYEPSLITRYLIDLCHDYNRFYHEHNINKAEENVKLARLALSNTVRQTLKTGLFLLGIESPENV